MRTPERRGALIPFASGLLALAALLAFSTALRTGAARRAAVEVEDLACVLATAQSAAAEATALMRAGDDWAERLRGSFVSPASGTIAPERTRRAALALTVGDVAVRVVRTSTARDRAAGAAPHGVVEMSVRVASPRGAARTVRQRRLFHVSRASRAVTLIADPLGTVVE